MIVKAKSAAGMARTRIDRGKRKLLSGAGGAALILACAFPSAAWAESYTVNNEAELIAAINAANANPDTSATIILGASFTITGTLPTTIKPISIDPRGNTLTTSATITSSGTGLLVNNSLATAQVANTGSITGGDAPAGVAGGIGVSLNSTTLVNSGTISAGTSTNYVGTVINPGAGVSLSSSTLVNSGTVLGGNAQGGRAGAGVFSNNLSGGASSVTNTSTGIIRGGSDLTGVGTGEVAILIHGNQPFTLDNSGLIEGGNGAAAITLDSASSNVSIINSGIIRAGAGGTVAIDLRLAPLNLLELRAGSDITGLVLANAGGAFAQTLQLGGGADASFDMSLVGAAAQYRGFTRFVKSGASTWTLTGDVTGMPGGVWNLQQGTLVFDENTVGGSIPAMIGAGALVFRQNSALSVGSLNGAISVLQNGSGTTTLVPNTHSGGTTIAAGKLSIGSEQALGSGAFTITGGALQWTGNGNIARAVNWAPGGAEIEVSGTSLTLSQPLLGGGALTKSGVGSLILTGDNTYTGGTTVAAGTLRVNGSILGDVLDNGTLIFGNSTAYTYAGSVTGTGSLNAAGSGLLTLTGNSNYGGTTTISGSGGLLVTGGADIAYGGATTLSAGQLLINAGSTVTAGGATAMTSTNATLTVDGTGSAFSTASMNVAGSTNRVMAVNVTNGGHLNLTTSGMSMRTLLGTARFTINGTGSLADMADGLTVATQANTGGAITISGGGALRTGAASTVGVAAGNAQNGTTRLLDVTVTGAGSNWTSTSSLLMTNGNFKLDQGGSASFASATFGTVSGAFPATLTVSDADSHFATTGDLVIGSGAGTASLTLSNGGAVDVGGSLVLADAGTATGILNIGGGEGQAATGAGSFTAPTVSLGSTTSRINFNHIDPAYSFASAISGSGVVNQIAGTTILSGANSYTGGTFLNGGTLSVANDGNLGDPTGALSFDGGTLQWTGASFSNTRTINWGANGGGFDIADPAAIFTVTQALAGGGALTKSGSGTLTLAGANGYTGGTFLNGGTLSVANDGNLGDAAGALNFNGGTLQWTSGNFTNARTINWGASGGGFDITNGATIFVVPQALAGSGALTKSGAGTLALTGTNTYTGGTTITGGTLRLGTGGTTGSILGDVVNNGTLSFSRSDAWSFGGSITGTGSVTSIAGGVTTLTGNSNYAGATTVTGGGGIRVLGATVNSGSALASGGSLTVDAGGVLNVAAIAAQSLGGIAGSLNVQNGGVLQMTGDLILRSSPTAIVLSTLNISGPGSRADVGGSVLLAASSASNIDGVNITGGGKLTTGAASTMGAAAGNSTAPFVTIDGAGSDWTSQDALTITNGNFSLIHGGTASFTTLTAGTVSAARQGSVVISDAGSQLTTSGNLVIGSGAGTASLTLSNGGAINVAGSLVLADAGTATGILNIGGGESQAATGAGSFTAPTLTLGSATSRLNFNHTDTDYVFGAAISGASAINQVAGDTNLTGASTGFTGITTVSGGTLRVNGTLGDATSTVNVLTGGRLGGAGTIGGNVNIADGVLAPGNSPGTLTIAGDLTLSAASTLDYEFGHSNIVGGPLNDLTVVGGNLTLDGTIDVTVTPGGSFDVGLYRIISYAGTLNDQGLALGTMPGGTLVQSQTSIANQVNLINVAGADVNFWDGGGTGGDNIVSGGTGLWQNNAGLSNWTLADGSLNTAYPNDAFAIFAAAPGTVTVDASGGAVNASGMQFASNGYLITGDAIGLTGSQSVIRVGDGTTLGTGYTATIASDLNGAGDLLKTDLGTLVLTGAATIAGDTYVRAGALQLSGGGTLSNVNGLIGPYAGDQATVTVTGAGSTWTNSGTLWVGYDGTGTLNVTNGGRVVADDSMLGVTTGSVGTVLVSGLGSTWENTGRITLGVDGTANLRIENGATVSSTDSVVGNSNQGDAVVTGAGSSWADAGQLTVGNFATGTLRIEDGATVTSNQGYIGAGLGSDGSVTVTGTGSSWLVSTSSITIGHNATGALAIEAGARVRAEGGVILGTYAGSSGTLTLQGTAANRAVLETSGITAGLGSVNLTLDGALLRATADNGNFFDGLDGQDLTIGANGLAIDTDVHNIFVSPNFIGSGALIKDGAGALVLSGDNSYAGGTTINGGALQLGVGGTTGSIVGDVVNNGDLSFYRSDDLAFGGLISGSGSVTHFGPGALTLTGTNTYTGATNVSNAGTLLINGDQSAATGLTTVATNATLGGTGTIGGSVDMSAGGTLAPGSNGAGTLTINGNLTLSGASTLAYEFGAPNAVGSPLNDLVDVGGNLTLDGTLNVTQSAGGVFDIGIYRLFNYGGTLTDNGLTLGALPAGGAGFIQTAVAGQVNLVNTAGLNLAFWDGDAGPKFNNIVDGGSGTWRATTGDNWTDITGAVNAPYSNGAIAIFSGTAGTVTVDNNLGAVTAAGMQFATTGYVIIGDPVTLTGAQATIRVGDGSAAGAGYTATIVSELTGTSQLVKTDLGTLALLGENSYAGGTRIDGGTLRLGNGGATGSITGDIVDNGALVVNRSGTMTLDGAISGSGTLMKLGSGTLVLSGTNSFAGGTTVGGGTIQVSSDANLGDVAGVLSLQGGTLQAAAAFTSARGVLLGSNTSNTIDTQGFDVTLTGVIGNGPNNQAGNFVNKIGSGTLTLTGANNYANRTVIAGGTLALAGNGTAGAGNIVVAGGTVFDISQTNIGARVIQLNSGAAGTIALGSKVLTLGFGNSFSDWSGTIADGGIAGGTGGSVVIAAPGGAVRFFEAQSYTGGTTVAGGTFVLAGNGALYSGGAVTVNGGTAFDISGLTAAGTTIGDLSGAGALSLGGKSLTFGTANSATFSGTISGAGGGLVKNGTGTFTLSGANSYTGTTQVNAGTLLVNGDQSAATGLTSIASGATLGGSGTIGGDVFVADGATLAPGNSPGTLTINGNLTLSGASTLAYEFGARNAVGSPLNDLVDVGGNLTLDGTINVAVSPGGAFDIGLYRIANYGGTLTNNGLAIGTMPPGADLFVQTSVTGQVNLVNIGSAVLNFWDGGASANKFNNVVDGGSGTWFTTLGDSWTDVTGAVNAPYDNGAFAVFAGTGGIVNIDNGPGAVTASGLQFASRDYRIIGGALTLTGPQSTIRVGDGTAAGSGITAIIDAALTGSTQLVKTDLGTLVLNGTNSYAGGTAINGGTLEIARDANLGAAAGGLSVDGGTLHTTADINSARAVTLAGQGVFSVDAGTTLSLTGGVGGTGLLGKTGTGTLVLGGTGSYTGGADIVQGTLLVNGDYGAATGRLNVGGGATLGGIGTIGGDVSLGGTLAPGAGGTGTLTINGDLTIGQGATLAYEFGQANVAGGALNDLVKVGGDLTLDGTINVAAPAGGAFDTGIYRVFDYSGALTDNGLTLGAMPAGSNVTVQTSIAGQVNLVNSAGLTLSFWDGAAGPKNNGVINGGTGIWQIGAASDNWTDASGALNAAYSDGAFAVFGGTSGTVTVDNGAGQVTASGMQFATSGYTITGGELALVAPQATIRVGDGSTAGAGYTATINAVLSGAAQLVKTDAGTLVLGGTNSYAGGTLINGGTVQVSSDANLGAATGGLTLDGGTLATSASFTSARAVTVAGPGTFSTADGTTLTLGGTFAGTGTLTKAGAGTLVLSGNGGGYTGAVTVAGGTLDVRGTIGSAATVAAGARLEGTGQLGSVVNAGTVAPGGDGLGTLTLAGGYVGNGGTLEIAAMLGGDASTSDRLVVGGGTSGSTEVILDNRGGLGAPTVEGIKVVDVGGVSDGVFTLRGDYRFEGDPAVIAGAYAYRLQKGGVSTPADGDWYLRSALLSVGPQVPLYQPAVPVYEAYGQAMLTLSDLGTMQERIGNRQWARSDDGRSFGIWGRMQSNRSRPNAVGSTSFADVNIDSWKTELGVDRVLSERGDGSSLVLGVVGGYGEAKSSIRSPFGNGSIKTRGYSAGATLSWFGPQGFYVDSRAQVTWFDSTLKSSVLGKLADGNDGTGQAYSVEIGKRAPLGGHLSVTPQMQMTYSTVGFDRFTDPNDAAVSSRLGDSLKSRWGISLDRQDDRSHLYGVANLSYEWLDGTVTDVSGAPIARENHRLWGEFGLGGSVTLGDRVTLYSEASANTAINDFGKSYSLKGVAGLRLAF